MASHDPTKTLEGKIGLLPKKAKQALYAVLTAVCILHPLFCSMTVDLFKRAHSHKHLQADEEEKKRSGVRQNARNLALAAQLKEAYSMMFEDVIMQADGTYGTRNFTTFERVTTHTMGVRFDELSAWRYWEPTAPAVRYVEELLGLAGQHNMLCALHNQEHVIFPPGYEDSMYLGGDGKVLAKHLMTFRACIIGAIEGSSPNLVQACGALETVADMCSMAMLNAEQRGDAIATAEREAGWPGPAPMASEVVEKARVAGGLTPAEIGLCVKEDYIATELLDAISPGRMSAAQVQRLRVQAERIIYLFEHGVRKPKARA